MEKIGILGTGAVGQSIGSRLVKLGYEVMMGSRSASNQSATNWREKAGANAKQGTFSDAAAFGNIIFNCTKGEFSLGMLQMAGLENFKSKILVDVSNPLDFSQGMPPILIPELCNKTSLGEEIQKLLPETSVVKTLNIVNCEIMVYPEKLGEKGTMLIAGEDLQAKGKIKKILEQFGWESIIDIGGIRNSRSTEMMLPVWLSIYLATTNAFFAFKVVE